MIFIECVNKYMVELDWDVFFIGFVDVKDIVFYNVFFVWLFIDYNVFKDISFIFGIGLIVICGKVGFGKFSLFLVVLNEMEMYNGVVFCFDEVIGYV